MDWIFILKYWTGFGVEKISVRSSLLYKRQSRNKNFYSVANSYDFATNSSPIIPRPLTTVAASNRYVFVGMTK